MSLISIISFNSSKVKLVWKITWMAATWEVKHGILTYIPGRADLLTLEFGNSLKCIYSLIELLEYSYTFPLPNRHNIFFIQYLWALYVHFYPLKYTKTHEVFYHPYFSDKETKGHRVHTTSKWDLNRVYALNYSTICAQNPTLIIHCLNYL